LQEWIKEKPERDKINRIEPHVKSLIILLDSFENKSNSIENAKAIINQCKPLLINIKSILGINNDIYLKLSTRVASIAQHNIIEDVNGGVKNLDLLIEIDRNSALNRIKDTLKIAWEATLLLGSLDMESNFKMNRYVTNKESLKGLCSQFGIITSFNDLKKVNNVVLNSSPKPFSTENNSTKRPSSTTTNNESDNQGCMIFLIFFLVIGIIVAIVSSNSNNSSNNYNSTDSVVVAVDTTAVIATPVSTAPDFSNSPEDTNNEVVIKESEFKGNQLLDGASPLNQCFGKGKFSGNAWIQFDNSNLTDVIVCLVNVNSGKTIRNEYIRAGSKYTMRRIPTGTYYLKGYYGNDWNPNKSNFCGTKGGFDTDEHFSKSDNYSDYIEVENTDNSYTTGTITLYSVSNGNMSTQSMNESEFFNN